MQDIADSNEPVHDRFRLMYEETLPVIYGFLLLRAGGNRALAEDLTADTYVAAVAKFKNGDADDVTISWLRTVARRRLIDHWRRRTVAADNALKLVVSNTEPVDEGNHGAVIDTLATLNESQQEVLVMKHCEGFSVVEIAELLGRTPKAIESLLARARAAFRAAFNERAAI